MSYERQKPSPAPVLHFAAGLSTGVLSAILLQPADLLKTRLQQAHHTSIRETLRSLTAGHHAVRQLWRGTVPSVLRTGLGSALYFSSLDAVRRGVARATATTSDARLIASSSALPRLSNSANLLSGAIARTAAGFVLMPLTVLKVRFESDLYAYRSLRSAAGGVFRTEGLRGFYSGVGATALRDAPYAGLYVLFYEQAKQRLSEQLAAIRHAAAGHDGSGAAFVVGDVDGSDTALLDNRKSPDKSFLRTRVAAPVNFISGVFAAATATALTNPFDAVKTRLQLHPQYYGNMMRAVRLMVRDEGVRSLFDGLAIRMARKALSSALVWTLYEELVRLAETRIAS